MEANGQQAPLVRVRLHFDDKLMPSLRPPKHQRQWLQIPPPIELVSDLLDFIAATYFVPARYIVDVNGRRKRRRNAGDALTLELDGCIIPPTSVSPCTHCGVWRFDWEVYERVGWVGGSCAMADP